MSEASNKTASQALPIGYRFNEYEIQQVIGEGGFGIVYRAWDSELDRTVAIKEFMPASIALRDENHHLLLRSERFMRLYQAGLNSFMQEAKTLGRFNHPHLLHVLRFWQANDTAYMVTQFYQGETLKSRYLRDFTPCSEEAMRDMLPPLLSALKTLHDHDYLHRDIAPDNILLQQDGAPVLLDFGSACKTIGHLTDKTEIMLKPGYAPIEQYSEGRDGDQGPWTDIYALGAVLHTLICGEAPPVSVVRSLSDSYQPLAERELSGYSRGLLHTIDQMLACEPAQRPQSIVALRDLLVENDREVQCDAPEPELTTAREETLLPAVVVPEIAMSEPAVVTPRTRRPLWIGGGIAAAGLVTLLAVHGLKNNSPPHVAVAPTKPAVEVAEQKVTPSPKPAVASVPVTPAQIYLRAADATQLTQVEINGKAQSTLDQDGMKRLSLVPGDYQLQVTLKQGGHWQHTLHIDEGSGTWLVNVPTPAG
ncbi:serine/threonine protein kinase [Pantoea sp. Al-1710]|uniref:Serine/threonine protein kinase n=1 Tax=Candidatus Pantoea communis TaxID=2608354 RepID=A0ABX0RND2_9GAMM|nr:serine/threonine-protein kinase [Pantoea communis]NIG17170.1 serine/threonine protein kinase [Pantoea communis]